MHGLVECVPNVTARRRPDIVRGLADAVGAVPRIRMLDVTSDADQNRSVLTSRRGCRGPSRPRRSRSSARRNHPQLALALLPMLTRRLRAAEAHSHEAAAKH